MVQELELGSVMHDVRAEVHMVIMQNILNIDYAVKRKIYG